MFIEPEVGYLCPPPIREKDVAWAQVAMNDTVSVRKGETLADLLCKRQERIHIIRLDQSVFKASAAEIFHYNDEGISIFGRSEDVSDVFVSQRSEELGLYITGTFTGPFFNHHKFLIDPVFIEMD